MTVREISGISNVSASFYTLSIIELTFYVPLIFTTRVCAGVPRAHISQ